MNKLKRYGIIFLSCMTLSTATTTVFIANTIIAEAHSGCTDANGGHRDNKNKSGLGSYHYHCNGHPAHLHTNGVCPYAVGARQIIVLQETAAPRQQKHLRSPMI